MAELLSTSGLQPLVDPGLCLFSSVEGLDKGQPAFFELARSRAAMPAASCMYVGEDAAERAIAASVGFQTSPQPLHALYVIEADLAADPTAVTT
jgi:FMN phosphatase YigB (HAD superfamily)